MSDMLQPVVDLSKKTPSSEIDRLKHIGEAAIGIAALFHSHRGFSPVLGEGA